MDPKRIKELKSKGWKVGGVEDFLQLSEAEASYIELKLSLSEMVKEIRESRGLTQMEASKLLGSSQSRISKMEAGDSSVSIDLQIKSLLVLGATRSEICKRLG